jgi:hypothetical protein
MRLSRHQRALSRVFGVAIVLAAIEGLSLLAIRLSRPFLYEEIRTTRDIFREQSTRIERLLDLDSSHMLALDPVLGWRYRAGYRDSLNAINSQGLRSTRRYASQPPRGVLRVAAFGDSFVYGNDVADSAAWPALVEQLFPRIEVLNYGVGGYGGDQAYLRFCSEGAALAPRIVVIGFVTDDLRHIVNVYGRFISNRETPLVKPRFMLDAGGQLVLLPNPLPRAPDYQRYLHSPERIVELGADDYWYRPAIYQDPLYDYSATVRLLTNLWLRVEQRYFAPDRLLRHGELNASSTAFRIQISLFEHFTAAVQAAGARPIVVLFPDRQSLEQARQGRETIVAPLVRELAADGIEYVDLTPAFLEAQGDPSNWFLPVGDYSRHYAPAGNRIVAQWLGRAFLANATAARPSNSVWRSRDIAAVRRPPGCPESDTPATN